MRIRAIFIVLLGLELFGFDVMLLQRYKDQNISGWVMSEKLDGIRAYWDGKRLLTRKGNVIHAPKWFLAKYPPFAIDGELWSKREDFEHIASIVRDKVPGEGWKEIRHYIFDVPNAKGDLFERLEMVRPHEGDVIHIIPQYPVHSKKELMDFLKEVEEKGGEGVVVRDPRAKYERKRSSKILKVKSFVDDECEVVGYKEGKGKFKGKVGAIICSWREQNISIGSGLSIRERIDPPKIGSIITFRYKRLTKYGKPRFAVYWRIRR